MGQNQPADDLRGFMAPFAHTLGATMTATSEAGPLPGVFAPVARTALALHATGTLDEDLADITLETERAGGIGAATFRWRNTGETRSWDPPTAISAFEYIVRSTTTTYRYPHAVRRSTGRVVASVIVDGNDVYTRRQTTTAWSSVLVKATGAATKAGLVELPDGRLVCLYARSVSAASTQLGMSYSDDGAATWTEGSETCLETPWAFASSEILRLRPFYLNGRVGLLVWRQDGSTDYLYQLVSADAACTFQTVETTSDAYEACPDVAVRDGVAYIVHVEYDTTLTTSQFVPYLRKLASPSFPLSVAEKTLAVSSAEDMEWGALTGSRFTSAELALFADDDGILWLYGVDFDNAASREVGCYRSADGGDTWGSTWGSGVDHHADGVSPYWVGDVDTYMRDLCVVPERSRALLFHSHVETGPADSSLSVAYLGGWTTFAHPEDYTYPYGRGVSGWHVVLLPFDEPDVTGTIWTRTRTGAASIGVGAEGFLLQSTGGDQIYYDAAPDISGDPNAGILIVRQYKVTLGQDTFQVRISNGTNAFEIRVLVSPTDIQLRDMHAGTDIATVTTTAATFGIQVAISVRLADGGAYGTNTGRVTAKYRQVTDATGYLAKSDRGDWATIGISSVLQSAAVATSRIRWGHTLVSTNESTTRWLGYTHGQYVAGDKGDADPDRGRTMCSKASPAHIHGGLRVHATRGPTVSGDSWTHTTHHHYAVENIDVSRSASPRVPWRSTSTSQQDIKLTGLDLGFSVGELVGCFVHGANFRTASLYRDLTATDKILDLDLALATGLNFARDRDQVSPVDALGSTCDYFLHENFLAGGSFRSNASVVRRIRYNFAGNWLASGTYRKTRLTLTGYAGGDPASANTGEIWSPTGLFINELLTSTDNLMLRIPSQATAEGYFELGCMVIGRVRLVGRQWGHGRVLEFTPAYEIVQSKSGSRHVRVLGPARRATEVNWSFGLDQTGLHTAGTAPDYQTLGYNLALPIGVRPDTPTFLQGLSQEISGAATPIVLIPAIPQPSAAPTAASPIRIVDPYRLLYARMVSESLRADNVWGDEHRDPGEVVRVGTARFEEEV